MFYLHIYITNKMTIFQHFKIYIFKIIHNHKYSYNLLDFIYE